PSLEHEKELVFVLVAVPVDELALDHGKSNDAIVHARERLIHPRFIPLTLRGNGDLRQLTVLVVVPDVVVLHRYLPVVSQIVSAQIWAGDEERAGQPRCYPVPGSVRPRVAVRPRAHVYDRSVWPDGCLRNLG